MSRTLNQWWCNVLHSGSLGVRAGLWVNVDDPIATLGALPIGLQLNIIGVSTIVLESKIQRSKLDNDGVLDVKLGNTGQNIIAIIGKEVRRAILVHVVQVGNFLALDHTANLRCGDLLNLSGGSACQDGPQVASPVVATGSLGSGGRHVGLARLLWEEDAGSMDALGASGGLLVRHCV
ncbi:hypothetical protein PG995_014807 [Apiospora arundinis]